MAVKIRLTRMGSKKKPFYRINVADSRAPRDGRFIETVGTYNPLVAENQITVKEDRVLDWLAKGAQPSSISAVNQAMRRIQTCCTDSLTFLKNQPDQSVDIIYCDPMFSEVITESENLSGLKPLANYQAFSEDFLAECKRVAREKIILKAHFRDPVFEDFGFTRHIRPYQKFHFGEIVLGEKHGS